MVSMTDPVEGAAISEWLSADGFEPVIRPAQAAADQLRDRAFALLITDAALAFRRGLHPSGASRQATTIVIGDAGSPQSASMSAQTVYLTRPIDRAMLACFVSMSVLDERPVRRSARKSVNRFDAVVNGMPSKIVDVSVDGLRLEVAADRRSTALPPYFTVRVPLVGVAVMVQRMWTRSAPRHGAGIWYGAALAQNRVSIDEAWRRFVDTLPAASARAVTVNT
jgi:hypothetical protein